MGAQPCVQLLIFQATPFCNINCSYCYLPNRAATERISPAIVNKAARSILQAGWVGRRISVVWHAGEPLTVGPEHLEKLMDACAPLQSISLVQHCIQTNATLIDERFCHMFARHNARIGVSIDGPRDLHDRHRLTRSGKGTFEAAMRGVGKLRQFGIGFDAICVLSAHSLDRAEEIYEFFASLGASTIGFNVDEIEGTNLTSSMESERFFERLSAFWDTMLRLHFERRAFRLREADGLVELLRYGKIREEGGNQQLDPFSIVTVGVDGSVGTFSPELLGQRNSRYCDFSIGNIFTDSFTDMVRGERMRTMQAEIEAGIQRCASTCSYFELCGGGAPSNKISEHGTFDVAETRYCRATKVVIIDSLLKLTRPYVGNDPVISPGAIGR